MILNFKGGIYKKSVYEYEKPVLTVLNKMHNT